jgi:hypothetical protein
MFRVYSAIAGNDVGGAGAFAAWPGAGQAETIAIVISAAGACESRGSFMAEPRRLEGRSDPNRDFEASTLPAGRTGFKDATAGGMRR